MVTADSYRAVDGVTRALEQRDFGTIIPLAVSMAGGTFVAQELTEQVLPMLDMSGDPSSTRGLAAAFGVKLVGAMALVLVGNMVGGQTFTGIATLLALGMLGLAGADFFDLFQQMNLLPGNQPRASASPSPSQAATATTTASTRPQATPTAGRRATNGASQTGASSPRSRRREMETWG